MPTAPDNTNVAQNHVSGQIVTQKGNLAIANLVVVLYDLDDLSKASGEGDLLAGIREAGIDPEVVRNALGRLGNRLGSTVTDSSGRFLIEYADEDFGRENKDDSRPDLFLIVLAPDRPSLPLKPQIIYFSREIRRNAGRSESYFIQLSDEIFKQWDLRGEAGSSSVTLDSAKVVARQKDESNFASAVTAASRERVESALDGLRKARDDFRVIVKRPTTPGGATPRFGASTHIALDDKVVSVTKTHYEKQVQPINQMYATTVVGKGKGMHATVLLNAEERMTYLSELGDIVSLSGAQADAVRGKFNTAGDNNLLMTSDNPILRECLHKATNVQAVEDLLNRASSAPVPAPAPPLRPAPELPDPLDAPTIHRMLANVFADGGMGDLPPKANQDSVNTNVAGVALRKGPAEQTAYYDFNVLNIAFGHVWKQLIDYTQATAAHRVKVEVEKRGGKFPVAMSFDPKAIFTSAVGAVGIEEVPPQVAMEFDISREEWLALTLAQRSQLQRIANDISQATNGLAYDPDGGVKPLSAVTPGGFFSGIHTTTITVPPGYYKIDERYIDRLKSDLHQKGESLLDHVRATKVASLHSLLKSLDEALKSKHSFTAFGADETARAINFGLMVTYRQRWEPLSYQVGDLVKSVPLAPKEERKYSVKKVQKLRKIDKEARKYNSTLTRDTTTTGRDEEEIVLKAHKQIKFDLEGSYSRGGFSVKSSLGIDSQKESQQNRKRFREAIFKATQEVKQERVLDISVEAESELEVTESGTISNPNDEVAVTYLFYELQKRFKVSEQLYRIVPVILVAQEIPDPEEITEGWVAAHDWILNRVLLDDSFRPALTYVTQGNVGDDYLIRELRRSLRQQRQTVERLQVDLAELRSAADNRYAALEASTRQRIDEESDQRHPNIDYVLWFKHKTYRTEMDPETAKALEFAAKDAHEAAVEKAENVSAMLQRELQTLGQVSVEYAKAYRDHLDKETSVSRLLVHIKENIINYMQAIWEYEHVDQRFMRLLGTPVPQLSVKSLSIDVEKTPQNDLFKMFRKTGETLHHAWIRPEIELSTDDVPIEEVADISDLLGIVGNYLIFPMKQQNAITEMMSMPYVDMTFGAMDPDQMSNISLEEYVQFVNCLRQKKTAEEFDAMKDDLNAWLRLLLADQLRNGDEIIVPTGSLYIDVMTSGNTLMEDFKLMHRAMDVQKVRAEVLASGVEALRKAKRIVADQLDDPDVERVTEIRGNLSSGVIDTQ